MRASIIMWSTLSGIILGVFIDATLIGVALLFSALVPAVPRPMLRRWLTRVAAAALIAVPLAMAVLGYLEGELKAV